MSTLREKLSTKSAAKDVVTQRSTALKMLLGASLVATPAAAACDPGPSYQRWAATEGAAGRINLEDVQTAFRSTSSVTDFERMVNEIYEGDGIVLIRAEQNGESMSLEGWEDLNQSGVIENNEDDLLFSIVRAGGLHQHEMRGYGATDMPVNFRVGWASEVWRQLNNVMEALREAGRGMSSDGLARSIALSALAALAPGVLGVALFAVRYNDEQRLDATGTCEHIE